MPDSKEGERPKTIEEEREEAGWKPTGTVLDYLESDKLGLWNRSRAPGVSSTHETGVLYMGPWENEADGFSEHTRRCARALSLAGLPVHLRSATPSFHKPNRMSGRDLRDEMADLLNESIHCYSVMVHQVVPSGGVLDNITVREFTASQRFPKAGFTMQQQAMINRGRVISAVWEREDLSDVEVRALKRVAQVWVACKANLEMLERHGVDNGRWVPIPYLPDDPLLQLNGLKRRRGPVRFYAIGKWEPRKEHRNLLGAFLREFAPGEAKLWLKTSPRAPRMLDYPASPHESITTWLKDERVIQRGWTWDNIQKFVHLIMHVLPQKQIVELHSVGDVYVSASRGEGFDMPSFDAKMAGNLLVYTPSGGPQDFAGQLDERVEPTGSVPCHPFYEWGDATYLDYDVNELGAAMRRAWITVRKGQACRGMDLEPYSMKSVGEMMKSYSEEVMGRVDG